MKISHQRFSLIGEDAGNFAVEKVDVKIANISETESTQFYRQMLIDRGFKEHIGSVDVPRERGQSLRTISLFGVPLKCSFVFWRAKEDTGETGRANLFIGQPNHKNYPQSQFKHSIVLPFEDREGNVKTRVIHKEIPWMAPIITNRSFREGMEVTSEGFVEYLLIPFTDIITYLKETKKQDFIIKHETRKKYLFDSMIKKFEEFAKNYKEQK